jgi:hypothetical protein
LIFRLACSRIVCVCERFVAVAVVAER